MNFTRAYWKVSSDMIVKEDSIFGLVSNEKFLKKSMLNFSFFSFLSVALIELIDT